MQDLVVLVADKNMQFALQGALARPQAARVIAGQLAELAKEAKS